MHWMDANRLEREKKLYRNYRRIVYAVAQDSTCTATHLLSQKPSELDEQEM